MRTPDAKSTPITGCTCIWLNSGAIISMGSSIEQTFTSGVASSFIVEYSVVVLPEPVGPVTSTMPYGSLIIFSQRSRSSLVKPNSGKSRTSTSCVKIRITTFSPNAVGMVEIRSSISPPPGETVLMRPSCGRRRSTISMRASSLMRLVIASNTGMGMAYT